MKAYLIARVSTEDQEDALPGQIYRLKDYAQRQNYQAALYELQESAYKDGRKLFAKIVDEIATETEKVIVVFDKIDRYSRDSGSDETRMLRKLCKAGKIEIHFPSDSLAIHSKSPAQAWFMLGMGETTAEYYSRSVSDNVRRRFEQMRRDGLLTGKAPYGYRNVDRVGGKKWVNVDKFEAQVLKAMYKQYATGVSSLKLVRKYIMGEFGVKLPIAQIHKILTNPFYKGEMRVEGKLYPHHYDRIISEKLYSKVKDVLAGFHVQPTIYAGLPYTYRGLITCADCGKRVTFEKKKQTLIYGHCTQTGGKHGAAYVREEEFTKQFEESIRRIHIPEQAYVEVSQKIKVLQQQDTHTHAEKLATLDAEIKKYDLRLESMYDDKLDGQIPPELYAKKYTEFTASKQVLQKRRNKFELMAKDTLSSKLHLLKLARIAPKLFKKGKIEQKRALLKLTHSNLELAGRLLRSKLRKPFDTVAICNETGNWQGHVESNHDLGFWRPLY